MTTVIHLLFSLMPKWPPLSLKKRSDDFMTTIIILILCGFLTNILSAIFGVGGGIIVVPVLRMLFPEAPVQSIAATSLMVVMLGSFINILMFRQVKSEINIKKLAIWCIAMLIGVQSGFFLGFFISDKAIMLGFAIVLFLLAIKTIFGGYRLAPKENKPDTLLGVFLCTIGGMIAGVTGLGGGSVLAPLISQLPSISSRQIAVYTNWMMFIGGFGSMWSYLTIDMDPSAQAMAKWQVGYVNFYIVSIIFVSALLISRFSMQLRGILSENLSRIIFAGLLVVIALFILFTL